MDLFQQLPESVEIELVQCLQTLGFGDDIWWHLAKCGGGVHHMPRMGCGIQVCWICLWCVFKLFLTVFFLASGFKMFQVIFAVQPYLDIFDKSTRTVNDNFYWYRLKPRPSFKFWFPGCAYSRLQWVARSRALFISPRSPKRFDHHSSEFYGPKLRKYRDLQMRNYMLCVCIYICIHIICVFHIGSYVHME